MYIIKKMILQDINTNKIHYLTDEIKNYILKIFSKFSEEEKNHFKELYIQFPQNKTFEWILYIIIVVEEKRVLPNQEIGEFTKGLIDLSPPNIRELYIDFVKKERIINLNFKLCKTFEKFEKEINQMFS